MNAALELDDRIVCASAQMGMEMESGVMTTRRLGEVAAGWSEGDGGVVLMAVWADLLGSAGDLPSV